MLPKSQSLTAVALAASLSGCGFDITKVTPTFLDTKRGYGRVYKAEIVKPEKCGDPNYFYSYTGNNIPLDKMNGYVCVPADQAQEMLKYYDEYLYRKANCPQKHIGDEKI